MNLHDHEEKILSTKGSYNYSSIDELSDEMLDTIITTYENAYSKDSMTNGILPKLNIIKAIYRQFLSENNKTSKQISFEEFAKLLTEENKNYDQIEKDQAKDLFY